MTHPVSRDDLILQLAEAAEAEQLTDLIQDNFERMDGVFFERLKDRVDADTLLRIVRAHMVLAHPRPDLLEAVLLLMDAVNKDADGQSVHDDSGDRLDQVLTSIPGSDYRDLAVLVLDQAENAIARLGRVEHGGQFLYIAGRMLERHDCPELRPAFHLQSSSYHLYAEQDVEAARHIDLAYGYREHFSRPFMAQALEINRGMVWFRQGRYRQAADHFHIQAEQLENDPFLRASALSNEAMALGELGLFSQVEKALLRLIEQCQKLGDDDHLAKAHGNLANLYGQLGRREQERHHLRLGLRHARRPGRSGEAVDWHTVNTSLLNLARHHLRVGHLTRAETLLALFERQTKKVSTLAFRFTHHRLLVEIHLELGRLEQAQTAVETILHQEPERSDYEYISFLGTAGRVWLASGKVEQAFAQFTRAFELAQETDHRELLHSIMAYQGICCEKLGHIDQSIHIISGMFQQDDLLRREIDNPLHHTHYSARRGGLYDQILAILTRHASPTVLFQGIQQMKSRGVSRGQHPAVDLDMVLRWLPEDTALLEFSHQEHEGVCLLIGHSWSEPLRIPLAIGETQLRKMSVQLHQSIALANARPGRDPFLFLAEASRLLLEPLRTHLERFSALVVAPGAAAMGLPFHLFPLGDGHRVVHRWAVSYAPSASVWVGTMGRYRSRHQGLTIQAHRPDDPPESRQRFAQEADRVAAIFQQAGLCQKETCAPNNHPSATLRDVLAGKRPVDLLHLAVHGRFLERDLLASGLDFAGEAGVEHFGLEELAVSSLQADLVFLSGCETGRVGMLENREPLGLMSLLLGQGIRSAVLSHWPVMAGVDITLAVIEAFYCHWLLEGQRKDQALRSAMLDFADNPNPYDWGGFSLHGAGF
ncbi:MAG: CHAT domain-containing protein [Magnetococcus sp. YQC-5]